MIDYSTYRAEVADYMDALEKQLKREYGFLAPEWSASLTLIADNYLFYLDCRDIVRAEGYMSFDSKGRRDRHPVIPAMNNAQAYLQKLIHSFGLNIMAKSKLKTPEPDDPEDYLENLN